MSTSVSNREALVTSKLEMYKRKVRNSFIRFWLSTVLAIFFGIGASYSYQAASRFFPIFVISVISMVAFFYVGLDSLFRAGLYSERQFQAPKLWKMEGEYQKLRKEFAEFRIRKDEEYWRVTTGHVELVLFIKDRQPGLFAEYKAWEEQESSAVSGVKKEP